LLVSETGFHAAVDTGRADVVAMLLDELDSAVAATADEGRGAKAGAGAGRDAPGAAVRRAYLGLRRGHELMTALHIAAHRGDAAMVTQLVAAGANVAAVSVFGTALHHAVLSGSLPTVLACLRAGVPLWHFNERGFTGYTAAVLAGDVDMMHAIQAAGGGDEARILRRRRRVSATTADDGGAASGAAPEEEAARPRGRCSAVARWSLQGRMPREMRGAVRHTFLSAAALGGNVALLTDAAARGQQLSGLDPGPINPYTAAQITTNEWLNGRYLCSSHYASLAALGRARGAAAAAAAHAAAPAVASWQALTVSADPVIALWLVLLEGGVDPDAVPAAAAEQLGELYQWTSRQPNARQMVQPWRLRAGIWCGPLPISVPPLYYLLAFSWKVLRPFCDGASEGIGRRRLDWLLDTARVDINAQGPYGATVLHLPIFHVDAHTSGGPKAAALLLRLLAAGADPLQVPHFWQALRMPLDVWATAPPQHLAHVYRMITVGFEQVPEAPDEPEARVDADQHGAASLRWRWIYWHPTLADLAAAAGGARADATARTLPRNIPDAEMRYLMGHAAWARRRHMLVLREVTRAQYERPAGATLAL
jgi:hypothetical protein